jgi:enoyl-CoA hydratase
MNYRSKQASMTSDYDSVRVERDGYVGRAVVDRPEAMNAVNPTVLSELADAITALSNEDDIRVVVLTGAGEDAFIGGGDIKDFQGRSGAWFKAEFRRCMADLEDAIEDNPTLVVAAVNGIALGGGTEIAVMCDFVVATESARFGLPEITLGIIPGSGGTQRLTHLVGYLRAKELILTGRQVPAEEAADMGLASEAVPDDAFDDRVTELATDLAAGSQSAQWFAKESINNARANLETGLELEKALAALAFETPDKEEGLDAFRERRDADFSHDTH